MSEERRQQIAALEHDIYISVGLERDIPMGWFALIEWTHTTMDVATRVIGVSQNGHHVWPQATGNYAIVQRLISGRNATVDRFIQA